MNVRALVLLVLVACGEGAGADGGASPVDAGMACPNDLPAACPQPAPSYAADVAPVVRDLCVGCHAAGGEAANRPLDTHAAVFSRRGAVLNQVYACVMPPAAHAQPSAAQRQALQAWLVCGAPDN